MVSRRSFSYRIYAEIAKIVSIKTHKEKCEKVSIEIRESDTLYVHLSCALHLGVHLSYTKLKYALKLPIFGIVGNYAAT